MGKNIMGFKTKGMYRDLSVSAFNPEFAYENRNLRLSTNEGNTTMSLVNEKGTSEVAVFKDNSKSTSLTLLGVPVGTAITNHQLIVFTHYNASTDYIYSLEFHEDEDNEDYLVGKVLYKGKLEFSVENPLETLVSYESENIQKVYWTDAVHQPRFINVAGDYTVKSDNNTIAYKPATVFDFVPELQLREEVFINKLLGASGMFAPGVIQYAFTYYNMNGQESNIFYTSPLLYISYADRGAFPEDKVSNSFKITVKNVDQNFDYLRIYSIQRTSINAVPICKRIQDIEIKGLKYVENVGKIAYYTDDGLSGDSVDPYELLYKNNETIICSSLEQKDGTLFLGNIRLERKNIKDFEAKIKKKNDNSGEYINFVINGSQRKFKPTVVSAYGYKYANQLTSTSVDGSRTVPCAGFKYGNTYRLGVQFQYKTGKWSDPIWLNDIKVNKFKKADNTVINNRPSELWTGNVPTVTVPTFTCTINNKTLLSDLVKAKYYKARPVVVYPTQQDRDILCQGVLCRALEYDGRFQSSWFFRALSNNTDGSEGCVNPFASGQLPKPSNARNIRQVEVEGSYDTGGFWIADTLNTFHSPDIVFDDSLSTVDYNAFKLSTDLQGAGIVKVEHVLSDINIQTETPTVSGTGAGFVHKSFAKAGNYGIVSGLFYDDFIVDDMGDGRQFTKFESYYKEHSPVKWMVYPWNKSGSLNNDISRPANSGVQTAKLRKKVISNLRWTSHDWYAKFELSSINLHSCRLFSSNEVSVLKVPKAFGENLYYGNVDTLVMPDYPDGKYFAVKGNSRDDNDIEDFNINTPFDEDVNWRTYAYNPDNESSGYGLYKKGDNGWPSSDTDSNYTVGKYYRDLVWKKGGVRMKYKSTPHLTIDLYYTINTELTDLSGILPVLELKQNVTTPFGGESSDALQENTWIPCGEPVDLRNANSEQALNEVEIKFDYGDTYYQRWDCLKTYPFTPEDENQVVEIGSFMLETYVNIDGRYDRNRGQQSNLNITPQNHNLLNPVYSQINNFFFYKIQPDSYYKNTQFPNQITWSKTKQNGSDIDPWTNITLASVMELDGDKGEITALRRFNNQVIAFQSSGISQILYNESVQVASTEGVPIEIANSGKVQGKRYISDSIGCINKWSIATSPMGVYFMDDLDKGIYMYNGQLVNLSVQHGFNSWCKNTMKRVMSDESPVGYVKWNPADYDTFAAYYDKQNQDVLFINKDEALAFSEKFGVFTSFYDYGNAPWLCNLVDIGVWVRPNDKPNANSFSIWKQNGGEYCKFFGTQKPYWMTLVGNPEPQTDKTFTNIEFRACVDGEGEEAEDMYQPYLPFDSLETWNEYQHGMANLKNLRGHQAHQHDMDQGVASLKRKFRMWRCDIPRNNMSNTHKIDRMRNPWLYLKLGKSNGTNKKTEIHDLVMTYYS